MSCYVERGDECFLIPNMLTLFHEHRPIPRVDVAALNTVILYIGTRRCLSTYREQLASEEAHAVTVKQTWKKIVSHIDAVCVRACVCVHACE